MGRPKRWLAALPRDVMVGAALAVSSLGLGSCHLPATLCSGFYPGDSLDLQIRELSNGSGASSPCDSRLGVAEGSRLRIMVSEADPNGCGTAIGPIVDIDTEFETEFDEDVSRALAVQGGLAWVSETKVSSSDCTGILDLDLQGLEPTLLVDSATAKLVVGYYVGPGGASCPASCKAVHSVTITRAKEGN